MNRRLRKRGKGIFSLQEWRDLKKKYKNICPACGRKEPEIKLTRDHIIPLVKGGSNAIKNIQPLCLDCNRRKHAMILAYEPNGQLKLLLEAK